MPETDRLLTDAAGAFVQRAPIDWPTLLRRVRESPDRDLFESLHFLATLREAAPNAEARSAATRGTWLAASAIVASASIATIVLLIWLTAALANGSSLGRHDSQLLTALAFAIASVPLGVATFRNSRSLFLLATFTCAANAFARGAVHGLPPAWANPIEQMFRGLLLEAFIPACIWQFALDFPLVVRFTRFDLYARRAVVVFWISGVALALANTMVTRLDIRVFPLEYAIRDHPSHLLWRLLSIAVAPALVCIFVRSRWAPRLERRRVARLALAISVGTGPFVVVGILRTMFSGVETWIASNDSWTATLANHTIVAALALTPILSTAAVLADRPFELNVVLSRTSRYALSKAALMASVVAPLILLAIALVGVEQLSLTSLFHDTRAQLLIGCAAVGGLLLLARRHLLARLARAMSRRALHDDRRIALALDRLSLARGRRETFAALTRELADGLSVDDVGILMPHGSGTFVSWSRPRISLSRDSGIVALLQTSAEPLDLSPAGAFVGLLPPLDRDWIVTHGVHLAAASRRSDGEIGAVLTVGPKHSGIPHGRRDRVLLMTLVAAASATFDDERAHDRDFEIGVDELAYECPACGMVAPTLTLTCACGRDAVLAALPHAVAGKFRVQRRLGAGGMGVVYLAHDTTLDRPVALKTLPGLERDAVTRLRDEARAMAALNHESLATIYGLELWRGTPILVVEYFPEGTLADRLSRGPLPVREAVALGGRLASALTYMHERSIHHCDLKPSNVAFTATGLAKLLDFGLATISPAGEDEAVFAGTPAYLPPESFTDRASATSRDLWGLAVVIVEAACGADPIASPPANARERRARLTTCGPTLHAFLDRALARSPAGRYQTADEFRIALEEVARVTASGNDCAAESTRDASATPDRLLGRSSAERDGH